MPYHFRSGTASHTTIANPLNTAPATKNGGKMVACHSGTMDTAKSKLTMVCTLNTSGVPRPASSRYSFSYRRQWNADPRQPRHGDTVGDSLELALGRVP